MPSNSSKPPAGGFRRAIAEWAAKTWYSPPGPGPAVLGFTSRLYSLGLERDRRRAASHARKLPAFVISIGNLVVGGTGKTPFTIWLARRLTGGPRARRAAVLSRGYGSKAPGAGVARVPASGSTREAMARFGDEPLLMAHALPGVPVWVGRKRFLSGREAIATSGAEVLLLDDGFQHGELLRDLDLVLLDAGNPFGNGRLLPLGPLREPVASLSRADALLLTNAGDEAEAEKTRALLEERIPGKPIFRCRHRLAGFKAGLHGRRFPLDALKGEPVAAFAGIAHPERFFRALEAAGLSLCGAIPFPDHHPYGPEDLRDLAARASGSRARALITTEKDMVRLPPELQESVFAAELDLDFGVEEEPLLRYIESRLPSA